MSQNRFWSEGSYLQSFFPRRHDSLSKSRFILQSCTLVCLKETALRVHRSLKNPCVCVSESATSPYPQEKQVLQYPLRFGKLPLQELRNKRRRERSHWSLIILSRWLKLLLFKRSNNVWVLTWDSEVNLRLIPVREWACAVTAWVLQGAEEEFSSSGEHVETARVCTCSITSFIAKSMRPEQSKMQWTI